MIEDLVNQYRNVETELIRLIFRKLQEGKGITYLATQLAFLSGVRDIDRLVEALGSDSEVKVKGLLRREMPSLTQSIKAYEKGVLNINPLAIKSTLEQILLVKGYDLSRGLSVIRSNIKGAVRREYTKILTKAYIETLSGVYTYDEAIRRGVRELSDRGIRVVKYQRQDGKEVNYNIESAVRRTLLTEVGDTANQLQMKVVDELDTELVYVSQHIGARVTKHLDYTNHSWWQGRVYKRFGNSRYGDFYEKTGYGKIEGLKGVNCRHYVYPYFQGISEKPPKRIPMAINRKSYELRQEYNRLTRSYKRYKRRYQVLGEPSDLKRARHYSRARVLVRRELEAFEDTQAMRGIV